MSLFDKPISVTEIIREIMASNALYYSALQSGIVNYTALAKKIKPDIEKRTTYNVNIGTIVIGLMRIAKILME
jgi:hypothetical protein